MSSIACAATENGSNRATGLAILSLASPLPVSGFELQQGSMQWVAGIERGLRCRLRACTHKSRLVGKRCDQFTFSMSGGAHIQRHGAKQKPRR